MKLTFVGTGSGRTSLTRYHSSILLTEGNSNVLIDCGDSISRALLNCKIDFNSITDIIISHYHADHFSGLASLITQMKLSKRTSQLKLYTHQFSVGELKNFLNTSFIFQEALAFELNIIGFNNDEWLQLNNSLSILPRKNSHIYNKNFIEDNSINWSSFSFLISSENIKIVYTSDIGKKDDLYLFNDLKHDYLITDTSHISLSELEEYLDNTKLSKVFLTHIDDSDEENIISWVNSQSEKEGHIILAQDCMVENFIL